MTTLHFSNRRKSNLLFSQKVKKYTWHLNVLKPNLSLDNLSTGLYKWSKEGVSNPWPFCIVILQFYAIYLLEPLSTLSLDHAKCHFYIRLPLVFKIKSNTSNKRFALWNFFSKVLSDFIDTSWLVFSFRIEYILPPTESESQCPLQTWPLFIYFRLFSSGSGIQTPDLTIIERETTPPQWVVVKCVANGSY